ncbi:phosphatase PAP2 family protein [Streptomyces sp. 378]|uniref:phosphatase PAP2 family protein n=1 Tax=Streptomyces sp. 378 TaxID=3049412 RepID=UPI0024C46AE1|nr:phosphatase PAP2 family protein [Streptomyces sp. 378]MDK1349145.1 phosphatase PAP2 family protein [Streptomyces sp. 378]
MPVRPGEPGARSLVIWSVTLAATVGFVVLLALVRTRWAPVRRADQDVADALNAVVAGNTVLTRSLKVLTDLGGTPMLLWLLGIGTLWLVLRRQWRIAPYVVITALGAMGLNAVIKELVGRLRPVVEEPLSHQSGMSFPSGHALGSAVVYGVLLLVFLPVTRPRARPVFAGVMVTAVVVVGLTRIALGVHYPSDVLAGWLLGLVWLALTAIAFRQWRWGAPPGARGMPGLSAGLDPAPEEGLRPVPRQHPTALPRPAHALVELLVAWALIAALLYGLGYLIVESGPGPGPPAWDRAVAVWAASVRTPWLDTVTGWVEVLGGTPGIVAGVLVIGPLGVAVARTWRPMVLLALGLAGELSLYFATTAAVSRERPEVVQLNTGLRPMASFPSGHVTAMLTLTLCVAVILFRATRDRRWRLAAVVLAVLAPAGVAFQRLYAGVHHLSDVLASLLLAGLWMTACWWVTRPPSPDRHGTAGVR